MNRHRAAGFAAAFLLVPAGAWGHAGAFILAKCRPEAGGRVSLELSVDCIQHPTLTVREEALRALRQVLVLHTPAGPVALDSLAPGVAEDSTVPDPTLPFPPDPLEAGLSHVLVKLRYAWQPGVSSLRFAMPAGNPHDVLFWLDGPARPAGVAAPWQILIAGDVSPPVPVPAPSGGTGRGFIAAIVVMLLMMIVMWRRSRAALSVFPSNTAR